MTFAIPIQSALIAAAAIIIVALINVWLQHSLENAREHRAWRKAQVAPYVEVADKRFDLYLELYSALPSEVDVQNLAAWLATSPTAYRVHDISARILDLDWLVLSVKCEALPAAEFSRAFGAFADFANFSGDRLTQEDVGQSIRKMIDALRRLKVEEERYVVSGPALHVALLNAVAFWKRDIPKSHRTMPFDIPSSIAARKALGRWALLDTGEHET